MIEGSPWSMAAALVRMSDGELSVELSSTPQSEACPFLLAGDTPGVLFSVPAQAGEYPLHFDSFNSAQTPPEVEKLITDALSKDSGVLALTDEKGRRFLVQSAKIAYVEIGAADVRRVGFGVGVVGAEAVKNG